MFPTNTDTEKHIHHNRINIEVEHSLTERMKDFPLGNALFLAISAVEQVFVNGIWQGWGMMEKD